MAYLLAELVECRASWKIPDLNSYPGCIRSSYVRLLLLPSYQRILQPLYLYRDPLAHHQGQGVGHEGKTVGDRYEVQHPVQSMVRYFSLPLRMASYYLTQPHLQVRKVHQKKQKLTLKV